jgi:hypothetical protein
MKPSWIGKGEERKSLLFRFDQIADMVSEYRIAKRMKKGDGWMDGLFG